MSCPARAMRPVSTRKVPATALSRVDLPEPLVPITTTNEPSRIDRLTPSTAIEPLGTSNSANVGGTIAAGVELKALFLRLTPEFRYNATALRDIENPLGLYKSKRGTAYFLMNFGF